MTRKQREAHRARMEHLATVARNIVATGRCPLCGNTLHRNLALNGWWQCNGYASPGFRQPGHEHDAQCSFQCFTV
jgi:hypothetical protein